MLKMEGRLSRLRGLWLLLPAPARRHLGRAAIRLMAPRAGRQPPQSAPGSPVIVAGLLRNACGLGEGARLCAETLTQLGYPVIAADLTHTYAEINLDYDAPPVPLASVPGGALVLHLNPPLTASSLLLLGRACTAGRRIIGYWAWEQPEIPPFWRRDFPFLHEIWTPSTFCADAIRPFTRKPVRVVPHPVPVPTVAPLGRAEFGLPDKAFIVFAMLHFGSGFERKNPLAAIRAFRQAFGNRDDALLVLKVTADVDLPWAERALREAIDGAHNIRVMRRVMPRSDLMALIAASDVVLSLHRAEGFGLGLAEAMRLGRPVVATGWSGNMEFMDDNAAALVPARLIPAEDRQGPYSSEHVWADPDIAAAAAWLVRLRDDQELARRMAAAAVALSEERLGLAAYGRAVVASLPPPPPLRAVSS